MKHLSFIMIAALFLTAGCDTKPKVSLNGADLLQSKCASCHNLSMPPKTYEDEKAPPMMAVAFHVKDFMKVNSQSDKKPKFITFFQDYVLHPDVKNSFCDKESLESYGLMPSQAGKVSKEEVGAIASYVYDYYDQEKFLAQMEAKSKFEALDLGEQIATSKGCFTCHDKKETKSAPSFLEISTRDKNEIFSVIKYGSKGTWKGFEKRLMPPFAKSLDDAQIESLVSWIKDQNKEKIK